MRGVTSGLAIILSVAGLGEAVACQCADPIGTERNYEDLLRSRLERATNVVRGRITDVRAGQNIMRNGSRVVTARMKVNAVVKGAAPTGNVLLTTGFSAEDCGVSDILMQALGRGQNVTISVGKSGATPREFEVSSCGYVALSR